MTSIVSILASPRVNANSTLLAQHFCDTAQHNGAEVSEFFLRDLAFGGCQNLMHCKRVSDGCGISDDLSAVLNAISSADIVVLATPIYFTDICSQMKACIDRWFSFLVPDYPTAEYKSRLVPGKILIWLQTQGEPATQYADVLTRYSKSFHMLGFTQTHLIRACGVREPGQVEEQQAVLNLARETAIRLTSTTKL